MAHGWYLACSSEHASYASGGGPWSHERRILQATSVGTTLRQGRQAGHEIEQYEAVYFRRVNRITYRAQGILSIKMTTAQAAATT